MKSVENQRSPKCIWSYAESEYNINYTFIMKWSHTKYHLEACNYIFHMK